LTSRLLICACLLLAVPPAWAIDPSLYSGVVALFDLEFAAARSRFRDYIRREPDDPAGYIHEAAAIWWESSTELMYGKVDRGLEKLFFEDLDRALKLSKERFEAPRVEARAEAYLTAGTALGLRGQWHLDRDQRSKAFSYARKGAKHLRKCLEIDKGRSDAHLGLGLLAYRKGDKDGVYAIRTALDGGDWTPPAAAYFLLRILILDRGDYEEALPVIRRLRGQFPSSLYLRFLEAVALQRLGRWNESHKLVYDAFRSEPLRKQMLGSEHPRLLCGFFQHVCLERGTLIGAAEWTSRAMETGEPKGAWLELMRAYRGLAYDLAGEREVAARTYAEMRRQPEVERLQLLVETCRPAACGRREAVEFLRALSR